METKTLVIVFPLAAGAVGNCSVQWGLVCVFVSNAEITDHSHIQVHSHA